MVTSASHARFVERELDIPRVSGYRGEVVYMFAYDLAYEMVRGSVSHILGHPLVPFSVDSNKRAPRQLFFYRPQMVRLPILERIGTHGPIQFERIVKLLPVGAISITVRVPFEVEKLEDLVLYHDLQFSNGSLQQEIRACAEEIRTELKPYLVRPVPQLADEEAYTVFCLETPVGAGGDATIPVERWWRANRGVVACLLTQEPDVERLSIQEAEESTGRALSYYDQDLVVVDWDAALLIDQPENFDETLYVLELANLQLAELEAYDRLLDDSLDRAYRDLGKRPLGGRGIVLRELRELRIDLARFSDELSNITKFFGDWHLARVYENISARFHLSDWHKAIDRKLLTLDNMYQLLNHDQTNRWMLMLEVTIVLLFIVDLIVLVMGLER